MPAGHPRPDIRPLPRLWLLSDGRNDALLEQALRCLPCGSGFIYRHYHLAPEERFTRYRALRSIARRHGHLVILADSALTAKEWRADGIYGPQTAHAVQQFQNAKGLVADGEVGPATFKALKIQV